MKTLSHIFVSMLMLVITGSKWGVDYKKAGTGILHNREIVSATRHVTEIEETNIGTIDIQPYGSFPDNLIREAEAGILKMYKLKVVILKPIALPAAAFYAPRSRYRAEKLLDDLEKHLSPESAKIIGLTIKDISTTKNEIEDWGIFGLGTLSGSACVVSTFRLRAHHASDVLLKERLIKVINHEIGHTLGLSHCTHTNCLMEDGKGSIDTVDREDGKLCAECAKQVKAYLRNPN